MHQSAASERLIFLKKGAIVELKRRLRNSLTCCHKALI
jgi:hypothetical protein